MRAAVRHEYGPPEKVLRIEEIQPPTPRDHEVLVRVHAASVNLGDWELLIAKPLYGAVLVRFFGPRPRYKVVPANGGDASARRGGLFKPRYKVLGTDIAGRVEAVGRNVTQFQRIGPTSADRAYKRPFRGPSSVAARGAGVCVMEQARRRSQKRGRSPGSVGAVRTGSRAQS